MKYPNCTDDSCEFVDEGGSVTLMHSPIRYDRHGTPVGGGGNKRTRLVRCLIHNECFESKQTELDDARGVERQWRRLPK